MLALMTPHHIDIDPDEYLPSQTLSWCHSVLAEGGYDIDKITQETKDPNSGLRTYFVAYMFLRTRLQEHIGSEMAPIWAETEHPLLGMNWTPRSDAQGRAV